MTDIPIVPDLVAAGEPGARPKRVALMIDTTAGSPLHRLTRFHTESPLSIAWVYVVSVGLTFVPLVIAAHCDNVLTAHGPGLTFLRDFNVLFMLLVSLPALLALTLTDQAALALALRRIQNDGIVTPTRDQGLELARRWGKCFERVNIAAYVAGAGAGVAVAIGNYYVYRKLDFWAFHNHEVLLVSWVFLYCMFVFYAAVPLYVFRTVAMSLFLRDLVKKTTLQMLPAHPDGCGGLRPIGHLGLRNQYVLTVYGLNVAALIIVSKIYLPKFPGLDVLMILAVIAYLLLGPMIFIAPLLAFRTGMIEAKEQLMGEVAQRLREELRRLRKQIPSGTITKDDEDFIERLRKIGAVIDELPVWPFDARTMRKFLTAYVTPIVAGVGAVLIKAFGETVARALHLMTVSK